ncbi:hypothetical protein [Aeromonas caviae]|uniref:hypothetical protein n=1 Tax=Aeromonas caviae TaxID=648 RepID=UPI002B4A35EC|nr:hypothetical protein [Aeromonas caviae]
MNLNKNLPSKNKLFVYLGVLVLVCGSAAYVYSSNAEKKAVKNERLQQLIAQSKGSTSSAPDFSLGPAAGIVDSAPVPTTTELPELSSEIKELLGYGARRAKAEAKLAARKAEEDEKKLGKTGGGTGENPVSPGEGFLLKDEQPLGMGISFNTPKPSRTYSSLEQLTLRYAARVDGKLTAYVSVGESGRMIPAQVGKVIEGMKITSITDSQLCASQGKSTRCITMSY